MCTHPLAAGFGPYMASLAEAPLSVKWGRHQAGRKDESHMEGEQGEADTGEDVGVIHGHETQNTAKATAHGAGHSQGA